MVVRLNKMEDRVNPFPNIFLLYSTNPFRGINPRDAVTKKG